MVVNEYALSIQSLCNSLGTIDVKIEENEMLEIALKVSQNSY